MLGHITNANTNEDVVGCAVVIPELNLWAVANDKGVYKIDNIPVGGEYTITTSCLGMEQFEKKFAFTESKDYTLDISLNENSIQLENINVLAEEKSGLGSSSNIRETAIEHLQPSSLKDVMQLLPGQISSNPDLSGPARISIRDIEDDDGYYDENSSLGTAIIVDGAPVSNNAELQSRDNIRYGLDVRQISTDNIESVEVIRGIASVAYGDMTSGAVIVRTKSGATPINAKVTINPNIKKVYLGKGYRLQKNRGAINFDIDYTSSIDDKITPYKGFDRVSGQLGYSNTFMKATTPFSLNVKGKYTQTIDSEKTDPDLLTSDEEYKASEYGYKLNLFGKWALKKKLISNLNYNFSTNLRKQETYSKDIVTLGYIQPISNARTDTLMEGVYAASEYYSEMTIKGRPFDVYAKIVADAVFQKDHILNRITYGFDYKSNGNNGEGKIFDELKPPRASGSSATRPRPYNEIPALTQYSLFLEDNLSLPVTTKSMLFIQAGVRYNNYQPDGLFTSEIKTSVEPRVNVKYNFMRSADKDLSVFGGYGIQSKSPTIGYLYPDKAYFDLNSFNYFAENPDERLLLVSTRVLDTEYDNVDPINVTKFEAGFEGRIKNFNFHVTGYSEKSTNGLNFTNQTEFLRFNFWDISDPNIIFNQGEQPIVDFSNPTEVDTFIASYSSPRNNQVMIKKGVEYRLDFGELKYIKTSLNINGGYLYTKNYSGSESYLLPYGNGATQLPYVAVYPSGNGTERQRFNTNFIGITHIPKLGLIFTTTLQVIWKNTTKYFLGGAQPWEYTNPSGDEYLVKAPIALISKDGVRTEIPKEEILAYEYDYYLTKYNDQYFNTEKQPVHYQLNLKVTSEIGSKAKFSFFANNLTMHNPKYKSKRTNETIVLNDREIPIYFGLELTFLL
nr:TonB-dependent receptor [Maribellus maritimus]